MLRKKYKKFFAGAVMGAKYKAFEILLIAEQIERNGAAFYRKAAELFDEQKLRDLFFHLADWEVEHEKTFAEMKREVSEEMNEVRFFNADDYMSANPQVMAGLAAFAIRPDPAEELRGLEGREEILKNALKKEEDTIVFYRGLKGFTRGAAAKEKIKEIIKEEKKHIGILGQSLKGL